MGSDGKENSTYTRIRDLIVTGSLAPGSRVIESDLAERLEVSRTPVRAALQRLNQEGFLVAHNDSRKTRMSVAPLTQEDASELLSIAGQLEALAVRWIAKDSDEGGRASLADELGELNEALAEAAAEESPDRERVFQLDNQFHERLVDAGTAPRLRTIHRSVKPQADRYIRVYINALIEEIDRSVEEHETITNAIREGNPEKAERAMVTNWRNAADRLCSVIAWTGEWGNWR